LAISPPSDIVLDVARAADPADVRKAHAELLNRTGGTDAAFEAAGTASVAARAPKPADGAGSFKRFEAMVLQTFIETMLPKDAEGVYGKGFAGDMWKARMAEHLADVVSDRGGIGIAKSLAAAQYLTGSYGETIVPVSANPQKAELNDQLSMSSSLVHQIQMRIVRSLGDAGPAQTELPSK